MNPPRAAYLDYPLGHTSGRPNRPELNRAIVGDALRAFHELTEPGTMFHLPYRWSEEDHWKDRVMRPSPKGNGRTDETQDDRVERFADPQYQTEDDAAEAAGTHEGEECLVCAGIDY
ncbi:MAG: hypothetical protein GY708_00045 [Actinomycetia bacterium]|nr:hypothetical protein [Actinomycetes bacterium]MCP4960524.1 hypothetical protein [Actinomycetes bacterium]